MRRWRGASIAIISVWVVACNDTRAASDVDAGTPEADAAASDAGAADIDYEFLHPGAGEPMACGGGWCALAFIDGCGTRGTMYGSLSELLVIGPDWRFPAGTTCEGFGTPEVVTDLTAACIEGTCMGVDLRGTDWRECSSDDECATVDNVCCRCETGSPAAEYIGIRSDRVEEFRSLVCAPRSEEECSCIESIRENIAFGDEFYPTRCWHGVCRTHEEYSHPERYGIPTEP